MSAPFWDSSDPEIVEGLRVAMERLQTKERRHRLAAYITLSVILVLGVSATLLVWGFVSGVDAGRVVMVTVGAVAAWFGWITTMSWWWRTRPLTPLFAFGGALIGASIVSWVQY